MDRRAFLKSLAATTSTLMTAVQAGHSQPRQDRWGTLLPTRRLGKTEEEVTMLALGGAHLSSFEEHAQELIETAIEGGIRFFDTASHYGGGLSERLLGQHLVPQYREDVFLMSKAHLHSKADVQAQLDLTLRQLNTDYLDLWLIHQVMDVDDVNLRLDQGVLEAFLEAKESGKARYIGFSGHRDPRAHQRMLERTRELEVCLMPISCADASYGSFIQSVLPTLLQRDMGVLAMKTLAAGGFFGGDGWFRSGSEPKICPDLMPVQDAIDFAWSMPVSAIVSGANNPTMLQEKIGFARSFQAMSEEKKEELIDKVAHLTPEAGVEFYKDANLPEYFPPLSNSVGWNNLH